jgi:hypothetical protein
VEESKSKAKHKGNATLRLQPSPRAVSSPRFLELVSAFPWLGCANISLISFHSIHRILRNRAHGRRGGGNIPSQAIKYFDLKQFGMWVESSPPMRLHLVSGNRPSRFPRNTISRPICAPHTGYTAQTRRLGRGCCRRDSFSRATKGGIPVS